MVELCELLGMSFNKQVSPSITFDGLRRRGKINKDGWGLAFYPEERAAQAFKEPLERPKSDLAGFIKGHKEIKSKVFVGHVRKRS